MKRSRLKKTAAMLLIACMVVGIFPTALATATVSAPVVSAVGDTIFVNGKMPASDKASSVTLTVLQPGASFPANSSAAPDLSDVLYLMQMDYPAGATEYSFKFDYEVKNFGLRARINGTNFSSPVDFIAKNTAGAYLQSPSTVFVDDNFETGTGDFKYLEGTSTNFITRMTESNGNHYLKIDKTGASGGSADTNHRSYGYEIPEVSTGKIKVSFDTYLGQVSYKGNERAGNMMQWWFLGNNTQTSKWGQKLMLLGTDSGFDGYGMVGGWSRELISEGQQTAYGLAPGLAFDSLCLGQLTDKKWYSYEADIDINSKKIEAKLYDRNTRALIGTARGTLGKHDGYWGGMPDKFNTFFIRMADTEMGVDNVKLTYIPEYPTVDIALKSDGLGNILGLSDLDSAYLQFTNKESITASVEGIYYIYDDAQNIIDRVSFADISIPANGSVNLPVDLCTTKYGTYYLSSTYTATNQYQSYTHQGELLNFSIINKSTSSVNFMTGTNSNLTVPNRETIVDDCLTIATAGGQGLARNSVYMTTDGTYDPDNFNEAQLSAQKMNAHGMKHMLIVMSSLRQPRKDSSGNTMYDDNGNVRYERIHGGETALKAAPEASWTEYYDWYDRLIEGNPLGADYFEIGNEAYYNQISGQYYVDQFLKPFYNKNKAYYEAHPDEEYVPVIATFGYGDTSGWTRNFINAGGLSYCDGISVHIYDNAGGSNPNDHLRIAKYDGWYTDIKNLLIQGNKPNMPIYVTECGQTAALKQWNIDTRTNGSGQTENIVDKATLRNQAATVIEYYAMGQANGAKGIYTHSLLENDIYKPQNEHDPEARYAMLASEKSTVPYAANPAFVAAAGYNALLGDATYKGKIIENNTACYYFEKADGTDVVMMWADYGAQYEFGMQTRSGQTFGLKLNGADSVKVCDMYTNNIGTLKPAGGVYNITAGYEPIYLVGNFTSMAKATPTITSSGLGRSYTTGNDISFTLNSTDAAYLGTSTEIGVSGDLNVWASGITNGTKTATVNINFANPVTRNDSRFITRVYDADGNAVFFGQGYALTKNRGTSSYDEIYLEVDSTDTDKFNVVYNNVPEAVTGTMFVVGYQDGVYVKAANCGSVTVPAGSGSISKDFDINTTGIDEIKVFFWQGSGLSPLAAPLKYKIGQ